MSDGMVKASLVPMCVTSTHRVIWDGKVHYAMCTESQACANGGRVSVYRRVNKCMLRTSE